MTKLTRRKFVSSTALAAAGAALPASSLFGTSALAQTLRVRPNAYTTEGKKMLALYAKGVGVMKSRAVGDPTSWTFQWYTHWVPGPVTDNTAKNRAIAALPPSQQAAANAMWNTCQGHGPTASAGIPFFVPWHRMYTYYMEQLIRAACGDNSFMMPYWDYLAAGQGPIPPEFRDPSSPLYFPDRRPAQSGMKSVNDGAVVPISGETYNVLKLPDYYLSTPTPPNFSSTINVNPHGLIHDDVGNSSTSDWQRAGMAYVPTAAQDPIFFAHHSNIDRVWASWNAAGRKNPTTSDWTGKMFTFASPNGTIAQYPVGNYTSTAPLGYTYQQLIPVPRAAESSLLLAARFKATPAAVGAGTVPALGATPVQVSLASVAANNLTLSAQMKSFPTGSHYYLVVDGLSANGPTGNHYRIYLGAPANAKGKALEKYYVGTPSFFDVAGMGSMAMGSASSITFDVTDIVSRVPAKDRDNLQVSLIPTGAPTSGSSPAIAKISLIAD